MSSASALTHTYPHLALLLGAYFHQDWADDHASARDVVREFAAGETAEAVSGARRDIARLLEVCPEDAALEVALAALGSYYQPSGSGESACGWLADVRDWLAAG
jgi:hypothetical protein